MTEREKRIEEMAKVPCRIACTCNECLKADSIMCDSIKWATILYDAGYRKADKDSVFHIDISEELTKDFFKNEIEKVIKETAKAILQAWYNENKAKGDEQDLVLELAEKFGVEVE